MKKTLLFALTGLLLISATWLYAGEAANEATLKLIKDAKGVSRRRDPAAMRKAYEKVFAAPDLTLQQRVDAHLDIARVLASQKKYDESVAECDTALALKGVAVAEMVKLLNRKASTHFQSNFLPTGLESSYFTTGIDAAAETYRTIIAIPEISNTERIAAYKSLANCQLELMDVEAANKTLATASALPNLSGKERVEAKLNQVIVFYRQLAHEKAFPLLKELQETPEASSQQKKQIGKMSALILSSENAIKEREKPMEKGADSPAAVALESSKPDRAMQGFIAILQDTKRPLGERSAALEGLLAAYAKKREFLTLRKVADQYIPALIAESEKSRNLYQKLISWNFKRNGVMQNYEYVRWVTEHILETPNLSAKEKRKNYRRLLDINIKYQKVGEAKRLAGILLADTSLPAKDVFPLKVILAVLNADGKPAGIVSAVTKLIQAAAEPKPSPKEVAESFLSAARVAMQARYYDAAKALARARKALLVPEPPRTLRCAFLKDGPQDISEFMGSDYFKDAKNRGVLDRKYGNNLQFLLDTDATLTGRKVSAADDKKLIPAEFIATCDPAGVKIFCFATMDKAKDMADGLAGFGGYEIYLAAGENEPYHCYLVYDVQKGMDDAFVTQYNNAHFRRAWEKGNTAKIEHRIYPNGVATLLSLSWNAFFDKVPENGTRWDFEALHWEKGGYSWGGSKSVHNRSSFGKLIFDGMTPENRNAIKRRLVVKAADTYRKEQSSKGGYLEIWKDPELGDQKFFFTVVKPFQDKYGAYLSMVKPEMSAEDVELLYREAVIPWMNVKYQIADLRKEFLDSKRLSGK